MNTEIISQIKESDRVYGKLCSEAQNSYEQKYFFSALVCLFVLTEQILKFSVDKTEGNFLNITNEAKEKVIITDSEYRFLDSLRKIRNKIFHESHYPTGLEIKEKFWSFSDNETKELIYNEFSPKVFQLVFKLLTK